jgi:hypothetical protein
MRMAALLMISDPVQSLPMLVSSRAVTGSSPRAGRHRAGQYRAGNPAGRFQPS